ncbi:hypothetical protein TNIN_108401 [Trichonephila inaurata madagascariensis]|nr:hypothetical protein TNIN_108401 [Trichonephila inaurata madagascariensis]
MAVHRGKVFPDFGLSTWCFRESYLVAFSDSRESFYCGRGSYHSLTWVFLSSTMGRICGGYKSISSKVAIIVPARYQVFIAKYL